MFELIVILIFLAIGFSSHNQKVKKKEEWKAEYKLLSHIQLDDPIPEDVVDIESWKWDIQHYPRTYIRKWYDIGKYNKIIKEHPQVNYDKYGLYTTRATIIDWKKYYADLAWYESRKDVEDRFENGTFRGLSNDLNSGTYSQFIHKEDENGNVTNEHYKWKHKEDYSDIAKEVFRNKTDVLFTPERIKDGYGV